MRGTNTYSPVALSAICSNLSKACSKQFRTKEADLFSQLADYFGKHAPVVDNESFQTLESSAQEDLVRFYPSISKLAEEIGDRGTQRALTWGKKVTSIHKSLLGRFQKQQDSLLDSGNLYICEACGFIGLSPDTPELCPICKAPASRFTKIS